VRKGYSLIELLVALAVFGLVSSALLSGFLGVFRANQLGGQEARALAVAKNYFERAQRESSYNGTTLTLPALGDPRGFAVAVQAGGRLDPQDQVAMTSCSESPGTGYTCTLSCRRAGSPTACALVTVEVRLSANGKDYIFLREWVP
jgi:prepilin-type N-terminal cleavage/methylation domain-containing protein